MKPVDFVAKWSRIQQKETAAYANHIFFLTINNNGKS
jgi:hypothetical protein